MRTLYRAGYKGSTLILEESRAKQQHDWIEPTSNAEGTRYATPQAAYEAFQRAGAGGKAQFQLKPITTA
jgi:hypothetical protein